MASCRSIRITKACRLFRAQCFGDSLSFRGVAGVLPYRPLRFYAYDSLYA
jgi:hypothetical protein